MKPFWGAMLAIGALLTPAIVMGVNGPAETPAASEDPLVKIFGEGGMNLKADGGGMNATTNSETGEMVSMHIWGKVVLKSELMDLDCDDILIDMEKQNMIVTGAPVKFAKQDIDGTCGRLTYDIDSKKTYLTGKPKPYINQKQADGSSRVTSAREITMIQKEKFHNVMWEGDPEITVKPASAKKDDGKGPAKKAEKIDGANTEKIVTKQRAPTTAK